MQGGIPPCNWVLLGYHAASKENSLNRLFVTSYRSHLQEEGLLTLVEETDRLSRYIGIRNYHYSLRNIPEGRGFLLFLV